jgi:NADH-quinone oxidoreductase subunit G
MSNEVTLTIDNRKVTVPAGTLVVDAAKKAGIDIPVFCYHPKMEPVGMCRMCLVEIGRPQIDRETRQPVLDEEGNPIIQFAPKLDTGCTIQVSEGMVVRGLTEKVHDARQEILEFILTSHPLDCPICDKGGECPLQNLTMAHGPGSSRFLYDDKIHLAKHVPLGDLIYLDRERCIQCARCTRYQSEVADDPVIGFFNRGRRLEIVTYSDPGFDSYFSGNTTDICPVGALTTADFRFGARPWELNSSASICSQCPVGCNITFNTRREAKAGGGFVIKRVMPRQNEAVNEIWICDKGRFSTYHYTESEERLTQPLVRKGGELTPVSWDEAMSLVGERIKQAGEELVVLASGRLSNEDLFNAKALADHQGGKSALYTAMGGGDLVAQVGVGKGTNLAELGKGDAILVVACDLEEEAPIWWLRVKQAAERGATLIVANPRQTKTDRHATHRIRYLYGEEVATVMSMVGGQDETSRAFSEAQNAVLFFGSEGIGLEASQRLAQACSNLLLATGHIGKPNNGLIAVWSRANEQGAWDMGFRPSDDLSVELESAKALYVLASDPVGDHPGMADVVQGAGFVVVQELFLTETAKLADVVLPAQAFTEREGTFTSGERRVQRFYNVVPYLPGTRPDFAITAQIAKSLGLELEGRFVPRVMARIAETIPDYAGITYIRLAQVEEQWPIVGRGDMYYGGTTYDNSQGLGVQLESAVQRGETVETMALDIPKKEEEDGILAVPVTRLYDLGQTVRLSQTLKPRLVKPHVVMHPQDADELGIESGSEVHVSLDGFSSTVFAQLDETMPPGFVLVPRSVGIPIGDPVAVEVRLAERVLA